MQKDFVWKEKEYPIDAARLGATKEFWALAEELDDNPDMRASERLDKSEQMVVLLNCPPDIIKALYPEEITPLTQALMEAQWGSGDGEEGNPGSGK